MISGLIIGLFYLLLDFIYWAKWAACLVGLWLHKRCYRRRFDLYDFDAKNAPEKLGITVPNEEKMWEYPLPEEQLQEAADEVFIYGVNSKSESLVVRVSRSCNHESEAWIYLKLEDGSWYVLDQFKGFQRNFGDKCISFSCGGLQMQCMSPMRRWRISYCGMLKKRKSKAETEEKSVFIKFTFIWTASSDVFDASSDLDIQSTAEAMARAKWKTPFPPIHRIPKVLSFYAQSGVISGIVSVENEPDVEMYLFGEKIRHAGESACLVGCKFKHILGVVPESGLIIDLAKVSYPNVLHNFLFGYIVHPNSTVYTIKNGIITSKMSQKNDANESLTTMFDAGDKQYELRGNFVGEGLHFASEQGWNGHLEMLGIKFEIDDCKGTGFMLSGEISKLPQNYYSKIQNIPSYTARPFTVYFKDEASHSSDLTGGKGSSLGKLTKLNNSIKSEFVVPRGIVVTTAAYNEFLTPEILGKIENLKDITYGNIKGNIQEACKIVQITIEHTCLPDKITKEIEEKLKSLFSDNINSYKVAVRSSATGEDTDQMSAAGQMETYLGVQGLQEIFSSVKKCWASQFGYVAVEYKRQNGQILNTPMAVVIQEMVECEAAGVLFTCDPVTNNPSITVITGNYGLGESVVSGSEEPDMVILEKLSEDELLIKSKTVGKKEHRIVLINSELTNDGGGTVIEDVPEDQRSTCCISEDIAIKLGKSSLKIENYFKCPQDIEWGLKNNVIYILQSRPITTVDTISDYEIKHEFDGPLRCENDFFTRCNVGEVMPGAISPLGIDVAIKYFSMAFQTKLLKKWQGNNFFQAKYYQTGCLMFCNQMHMSVVDLLTRTDDFNSLESQSMMMGVFGRILDDPELKVLVKQRNYKKMKTSLSFYLFFLWNLFFCGRKIGKIKETVFNSKISAENGRTSKEIFDLIVGSCTDFLEPAAVHMVCSDMSAYWNMLLFLILAKAKKGIDNEVYSDFSKLLAEASNVESANIPSSMKDLAESIIKDIKPEEFQEMPVEDAVKWLETTNCVAGSKYRQFVKRHGHRCLKESDVHSIPWGTDPKSLVKLLQNMSKSCTEVKEKVEPEQLNILSNLTTTLDFKSRLLLKFILPNCRRGVGEREACKSNLMKFMDNLRKGFHHLSKAMVSEGYLPDTNLLFFLTIDEIKDIMETRNSKLLARANHRRKLYPSLDALFFPDISRGRPVPINEKCDEDIEYTADLTMKGIPVSQGTVKGYVRVALTLKEAALLKQGEILITYSTDIGWTPYFPILAGVVTELGGLISHGAVVSREYGLPCVVGLHGATKHFLTGDYVLLDGSKGILQRLSPPEKEKL